MSPTRRFLAFLSLALACLLLAGCFDFTGGEITTERVSRSKTGLPLETPAGNASALLPAERAGHIALLLPLQGNLGKQGQAIRNGFLAAYYYDQQTQASVLPTISVIDTSAGNIVALYQQAVAQGANLIVGPLSKDDVARIASLGKLPVPTLALNSLDMQRDVTNLFQFGLSPTDEAEQAANRARQDGLSRALIITPTGTWGQSIADAFSQRWQMDGGQVMGRYAFADQSSYAAGIRNLLQFSSHKANNKPNTRSNLSRRQDVDMVFLVGFPQQARMLRALLLFYDGVNLPVYSTSLVYGGVPSPQYDNDLNGVIFCDMPWVLNNNLSPRLNTIRDRIQTLWGDSYKHSARLYALGVDAYTLAADMSQLNSRMDGATGMLYLNQYGQVLRQLPWAQMQNGTPQLYEQNTTTGPTS